MVSDYDRMKWGHMQKDELRRELEKLANRNRLLEDQLETFEVVSIGLVDVIEKWNIGSGPTALNREHLSELVEEKTVQAFVEDGEILVSLIDREAKQ